MVSTCNSNDSYPRKVGPGGAPEGADAASGRHMLSVSMMSKLGPAANGTGAVGAGLAGTTWQASQPAVLLGEGACPLQLAEASLLVV